MDKEIYIVYKNKKVKINYFLYHLLLLDAKTELPKEDVDKLLELDKEIIRDTYST